MLSVLKVQVQPEIVCCTRLCLACFSYSSAYQGLELSFLIVVFPLAFLRLPGAVQAEAYQIPYLRARPRVFSLYFLSTHCEEIGRLALTFMELSRTFS